MKKNDRKDADIGSLSLVQEALREAIALIRQQIAGGQVSAATLQALASTIRNLRRDSLDDPADLDRRVRELPAAERQALVRSWQQLDTKGSSLA